MWLVLATAMAGMQESARLEADVDGDGQHELVTLGFDRQHNIRLAVTERNGRSTRIDLGQRADIEGPRTHATLSVTPADETGVPLIQVFVPGGEYCGSGDTNIYVSYTSDGPRGALAKALEFGNFFDAPIWSDTQATFLPAEKAVILKSEWGEADQTTGSEQQRLRFVNGTFVGS